MPEFNYKTIYQDKKSPMRLGIITTPRGKINTPAFVPVGTQASVKTLTPVEIKEVGTQLFFVNTYHTYLRPGMEIIKKLGGLHKFMGWDGPIITDSGGFQVFSLARNRNFARERGDEEVVSDLVKITEEGVKFRSHWDGSAHLFTPENSMKWQYMLGSDIHIAFDDCTPYPVTKQGAKLSMERTHRWAKRSLLENQKLKTINQKANKPYQALYGVVQGSVFEDLRTESAKFISAMDFDGIAIGGVSVGESKKEMAKVLSWVSPLLPADKPRHLLGVGEIDDIFTLIEYGIDTFDCVQPTRLARMGKLYIYQKPKHQIDITKAEYASDPRPIDRDCHCYTCQNFSRAYLYHLFRVKELLAYRLSTIHNLNFVHNLVNSIRKSIPQNDFLELKEKWL